jgi:hypothetical protein
MQHKWHKEIKAWADGEEIEAKWNVTQSGWFVDPIPRWNNDEWEYRIKPQPKEPQYLYVWEEKDRDNEIVFDHEPPSLIKEDEVYKYIGKIKLEVNDD